MRASVSKVWRSWLVAILSVGCIVPTQATLLSDAAVIWDTGTTVPGYGGNTDIGTDTASAGANYTGLNSWSENVSFTGTASAGAAYGSISAFAQGNLTHGDTFGGTAPAFHESSASASVTETFPVPAGVMQISHLLAVTGSTSFNGNQPGNSFAGITGIVRHDGLPFVRQWSADFGMVGGPVSTIITTTPYAVTSGVDYTLTLSLDADVLLGHPGPPSTISLDANGVADAGSTLVYLGPEYLDGGGKRITTYSQVTGSSGTTYNVIPEPSALGLLALGAVLLALARLRPIATP